MTPLPASAPADGGPGTVPVSRVPLGPRFVARSGRPQGWSPAHRVLGPELDDTLDRVADERGTDRRAVAAVLLLDRYALRLTAPVLAAFHELDVLLDARPEVVSLGPDPHAPGWLALAAPGRPARGDRAALRASLLDGALLPLADDLAVRTRAGRRTLRAAVAHAVALSMLHLSWRRPRPDALVGPTRALLHDAGLGGLVVVGAVRVDGTDWMSVRRRACCLAFRTTSAAGRYCGACPVRPAAAVESDLAAAARSFRARAAPDPRPTPPNALPNPLPNALPNSLPNPPGSTP
ncbi:hypothetical protein Ae406Ps2_0012 [Pseudonocardia sp. Ae406_Ps2]|uniref:hypothetical protein n=1 Tax=unclassified Pseudonocardia TaxID=2619320 RepID=UPI00094AFCFB|nr:MULTISPECIES: hypothetical protein [unclassified Pseudonocardia]OLM00012.1 hypothetical protein Ae406Ps2_0012 [Pseudonocardia sp. Ae406_Ps2]OLM08196.1 hypothetical protein Ae331Ps2_5906c [Pseudonocardia sp. Ae331_Ps2]OLM21580.1 hypothetical protein Ae706Ps2_0012 [Pseudonocardia sp. Ae706_Ps2]OLM30702.1 hypothetical protein Ae717Ps2_1597 [Pseudonocardia sp. Ae717_Ps2]